VIVGTLGRRSSFQNLPCGPQPGCASGAGPDDAHFSGAILRLIDDGATPTDNPFKHDITESESLLIRRDFGVGTDIENAPSDEGSDI
jgi:hypothetical protein